MFMSQDITYLTDYTLEKIISIVIPGPEGNIEKIYSMYTPDVYGVYESVYVSDVYGGHEDIKEKRYTINFISFNYNDIKYVIFYFYDSTRKESFAFVISSPNRGNFFKHGELEEDEEWKHNYNSQYAHDMVGIYYKNEKSEYIIPLSNSTVYLEVFQVGIPSDDRVIKVNAIISTKDKNIYERATGMSWNNVDRFFKNIRIGERIGCTMCAMIHYNTKEDIEEHIKSKLPIEGLDFWKQKKVVQTETKHIKSSEEIFKKSKSYDPPSVYYSDFNPEIKKNILHVNKEKSEHKKRMRDIIQKIHDHATISYRRKKMDPDDLAEIGIICIILKGFINRI